MKYNWLAFLKDSLFLGLALNILDEELLDAAHKILHDFIWKFDILTSAASHWLDVHESV